MEKIWHDSARTEYLQWQTLDRKMLGRINKLIESIDRNGYKCIEKPEELKEDLSSFWSVRIDKKNRIVFRIKENKLEIIECGGHYEK